MESPETRSELFSGPRPFLYDEKLRKAIRPDEGVSKQYTNPGIKELPFNVGKLSALINANSHHAVCVLAKVNATVGLGMAKEEDEQILDDLCSEAWLPTITAVMQDFETVGNGYLEVVRRGGVITGLHHIRAADVLIDVDQPNVRGFHYKVSSDGFEKTFSRFGDKERLSVDKNPDDVSEVIHFKQPTTQSAWYGVPSWISAVPAVELVMAILQHNFDFFNNRGVPEFLLFALGARIDDSDWKKITDKLKRNIGQGNAFKSGAINLSSPDIRIQLEKLGLTDDGEGQFESMLDTLALYIVTSHQVPPLLAGVQIPGKMGAANELPNAIAAFQALVISQRQKYLRSMFGCSLGKPGVGIAGLNKKSFTFNKITDEMDLGMLDAVARTRRPLQSPEAPEGTGPLGGNRPPEAGTPAARLAALRAERPADRVLAALQEFSALTDALLTASAEFRD